MAYGYPFHLANGFKQDENLPQNFGKKNLKLGHKSQNQGNFGKKNSKKGKKIGQKRAFSMQGEWELEEGITYLPQQPKKISYQTQRMIEMIPDVAKYGLEKDLKTKVVCFHH